MIVTSNLSLEDLEPIVGERTVQRLAEVCKRLGLRGDSRRQG